MHLLAAKQYSKTHAGQALVVMENGSVAGESYTNGFPFNGVHDIESCTKSFNGMAIAALIADGLLSGYNQKVSDVIIEWQDAPLFPAKADTTFRQLLSMTSGLAPALHAPLPGETGASMPYATAINMPLPADQVGNFRYGPSSWMVIGEAVRRLTGKNPDVYLASRILEGAGITIQSFDPVDGGTDPDIAGGAHMTARMLAKYGDYVRSRLSDPLIVELIQPCPTFENYGMSWWRTMGKGDEPYLAFPYGGFAAKGANNQRLFIFPDVGAVVARFGEADDTWSDAQFVEALFGF